MVSPKYTTLSCKGMLIHEHPQTAFLKRRIAGGSNLEFEGGKRQLPVLIHDGFWSLRPVSEGDCLTIEVHERENEKDIHLFCYDL